MLTPFGTASFTTRNVVAKQDGIAIFSASISFQLSEPGLSTSAMPQVPPPGNRSDHARWSRLAREHRKN
ncbi:MAG: hypothetical protein R3E50_16165 [Halioglobus sp.]